MIKRSTDHTALPLKIDLLHGKPSPWGGTMNPHNFSIGYFFLLSLLMSSVAFGFDALTCKAGSGGGGGSVYYSFSMTQVEGEPRKYNVSHTVTYTTNHPSSSSTNTSSGIVTLRNVTDQSPLVLTSEKVSGDIPGGASLSLAFEISEYTEPTTSGDLSGVVLQTYEGGVEFADYYGHFSVTDCQLNGKAISTEDLGGIFSPGNFPQTPYRKISCVSNANTFEGKCDGTCKPGTNITEGLTPDQGQTFTQTTEIRSQNAQIPLAFYTYGTEGVDSWLYPKRILQLLPTGKAQLLELLKVEMGTRTATFDYSQCKIVP